MDLRALNLNSGPDWGHYYLLAKEFLQCLLATCLSVFKIGFKVADTSFLRDMVLVFEITSRVCSQQDFSRMYTDWSRSTMVMPWLPLWPVLLQLVHTVLFLPVTKKRGIRKACQLCVSSHRPALLPIALQPMSSLCLCTTRGLELQETSLIFCFNWIFILNLNLKVSPEFFKEREEGTEIRKPSMITDFFLQKKVWSEPTVANWHFNESWRFRICHNYNFFCLIYFIIKENTRLLLFLSPAD